MKDRSDEPSHHERVTINIGDIKYFWSDIHCVNIEYFTEGNNRKYNVSLFV